MVRVECRMDVYVIQCAHCGGVHNRTTYVLYTCWAQGWSGARLGMQVWNTGAGLPSLVTRHTGCCTLCPAWHLACVLEYGAWGHSCRFAFRMLLPAFSDALTECSYTTLDHLEAMRTEWGRAADLKKVLKRPAWQVSPTVRDTLTLHTIGSHHKLPRTEQAMVIPVANL